MQMRRFRPSRNALLAALTCALTVIVVETASFLVLSLTTGAWMTWARTAAERATRLEREVDAGTVTPNPTGERGAKIRARTVIHPFIGYVGNPRAHLGARADPQSLAFGFPAGKVPIFHAPSPERVVVAVFGGSVAGGVTSGDNALKEALRVLPRFVGREIVVVGLAAAGYKQPQQLMALNYFLALGAHFDVAVNLDGFNEVALPPRQNLSRGVFTFYPASWDVRVVGMDPGQRRGIGRLTHLVDRRKDLARTFSAFPLRSSPTAALIWSRLDRSLGHRIGETEEQLRRERQPASREETDLARRDHQSLGPSPRAYEGLRELFRDVAEVWRRTSIQMHAVCQGLGIEYYHFLQPNQYVPGSKPLSHEERRSAFDRRAHYRTFIKTGYPWLLRETPALREQGVAFHDLTQVFAEHKETIYVDPCCHPNAEGYRLLARAMAQIIEKGPANTAPL